MAHARRILKLEDNDYELVPVQYKQTKTSELRKFDDPQLKDIEEYRYRPLSGAKKKIRLLQLKSGAIDGPDIYCELVEADYDNIFHIPTVPETPENPTESSDGVDKSLEITTDDKELKNKLDEYKRLSKREIKYEALSWCWGTDEPEYVVMITEKIGWREKTYKKNVRKQLALALKYLRHPDKGRTLWIDAICIDQDDPSERNHQVQMMSRIYTRAKEVCIWLGDGDLSSKRAIDFIRDEIMELRNFDALCNDRKYTDQWKALMMLMQRDWFSRRWVVQEIALASKATIHCGPDSISWKEFAVAVELFVEVETATHRLSEIMQKDEKFRHVPGWFEYVSELGASLLVQATGKVFRAQRSPLEDNGTPTESKKTEEGSKKNEEESKKTEEESKKIEEDNVRNRLSRYQTIDPLDRRSLLSLEYLVSTMFIFKASEPRDTIYAMLAISRDAAPFASSGETIRDHHDDDTRLIMTACESFLEEKPFTVDYSRPYADVCKDFVQFAIQRKAKLDPAQALDILCRPWALGFKPGKSIRETDASQKKRKLEEKHPGPESEDPLQNPKERKRRKRDPDSHVDNKDDPESFQRYLKDSEGGDVWYPEPDSRSTEDYWENVEENEKGGSERWKRMKYRYFPSRHGQRGGGNTTNNSAADNRTVKNDKEYTKLERRNEQELPLPSWIARVSQAPISLDYSPGIDIQKTGRANADPLVGHPLDGHRNYSAAQTQRVRPFQFKRRPQMGHYSLYVKGFILDEVDEVMDASQGGNIPKSWLNMAGWTNYNQDPPGEFWRTLVADRGRDNRNPPYYYARACRESVNKGGIASGRVDTAALINNERNSIVAEFCRRVHAVIWNRRLFKTKGGRLGLASNVDRGDKVCILYGCTVPVILQQQPDKLDHICALEIEEDQVEALKRLIRECERIRERKERYMERLDRKDSKRWTDADIEEMKVARQKVNEMLKAESKSNQDENVARVDRESEGDGDTGDRTSKGSTPPGLSLKRQKTLGKKNEEEAKENDPKLWYDFRGDCYIHGMMDGEAIRERLYKEVADRTFELR